MRGDMTKGVYPIAVSGPNADAFTEPFWEEALNGRLTLARCEQCGTFCSPPQPRCFVCQGGAFAWKTLPGTGTVFTFTVIRHPLAPDLREAVPYVTVLVELDGTQGAGARMLGNLTDCDPDQVRIGDRVQVYFDLVSPTLAAPRFRPLGVKGGGSTDRPRAHPSQSDLTRARPG